MALRGSTSALVQERGLVEKSHALHFLQLPPLPENRKQNRSRFRHKRHLHSHLGRKGALMARCIVRSHGPVM